MKLSSEERDVLFHILNNTFGASIEAAAERAALCDDISRDQFFRIHRELICALVNYSEEQEP